MQYPFVFGISIGLAPLLFTLGFGGGFAVAEQASCIRNRRLRRLLAVVTVIAGIGGMLAWARFGIPAVLGRLPLPTQPSGLDHLVFFAGMFAILPIAFAGKAFVLQAVGLVPPSFRARLCPVVR